MAQHFRRGKKLPFFFFFFFEIKGTREQIRIRSHSGYRRFWERSSLLEKGEGKGKKRNENIVWITRASRGKFRSVAKFGALRFFGILPTAPSSLSSFFAQPGCKEDYFGFAPKSISTNDDFHREGGRPFRARMSDPRSCADYRAIDRGFCDISRGREPSRFARNNGLCFRAITLII